VRLVHVLSDQTIDGIGFDEPLAYQIFVIVCRIFPLYEEVSPLVEILCQPVEDDPSVYAYGDIVEHVWWIRIPSFSVEDLEGTHPVAGAIPCPLEGGAQMASKYRNINQLMVVGE
jgi:hypothetical protein